MNIILRIACLVVLSFLFGNGYSQITLPRLISDGMVLQRDVPLKIWGWASAGEKIQISFNGKKYRGNTNPKGEWLISLPPIKPGGPYEMQIEGSNKISVKDILIGDVWFCSGQSNMVLTMERVKEKYPEEVSKTSYPQIRNFFIPTVSDVVKEHDDLPPGQWMPLTSETVLRFGAVTYFFAKDLYEKHHVPIGIINSSVGGTPIEAWISEAGIKHLPKYAAMITNFKDSSFMNGINKIAKINAQITQPKLEPDKGRGGTLAWSDPNFIPTGWKNLWLPGYWEDQGIKGLNGVIWFRKEIDVPQSMIGKPAKLFLGRIIDADSAFVNGVYVGSITYQYPPRRYVLPENLLKPGKNVVVVRVISNAGKGGFVPDKPYYLTSNNENIDLRGEWKYKVGQVFPPREPRVISEIPFSAQSSPTGLYNTMVAPAVKYAIKGINWYQGETNSGRPDEYQSLLVALINDWRNKWNKSDLPFLYVQLPNFMEEQYAPSESQWAILRNGQRKVLSIPNTAMVVTLGLGEWNDIHPLSKKEVGERLALAAEAKAYGDSKIVYSGPTYQSRAMDGDKMILTFNHAGSGLIAKGDDELHYFAIAGSNKKYVWAKARIEGDKVIVWSDQIAEPKFVRYAWADNPEGANLYNKEGLPASPFETEQ